MRSKWLAQNSNWNKMTKKNLPLFAEATTKKIPIYHRIKHKDYVGFHILFIWFDGNGVYNAKYTPILFLYTIIMYICFVYLPLKMCVPCGHGFVEKSLFSCACVCVMGSGVCPFQFNPIENDSDRARKEIMETSTAIIKHLINVRFTMSSSSYSSSISARYFHEGPMHAHIFRWYSHTFMTLNVPHFSLVRSFVRADRLFHGISHCVVYILFFRFYLSNDA